MNAASDFYKAGAKSAGAGLVKSGPFEFAVRLNYFGELSMSSPVAPGKDIFAA